jgi:hypothetical protein
LAPVTPPRHALRLEHGDAHPLALEQQRGGDAGDPAADDGDVDPEVAAQRGKRRAPGGLEPQGLVGGGRHVGDTYPSDGRMSDGRIRGDGSPS